jgi:hypothetical protein
MEQPAQYDYSSGQQGAFKPISGQLSDIPGLGQSDASGEPSTLGTQYAGGPAFAPTGSRSFNDSNPGNIKYGNFAASHGATGKDEKGFAIFPDAETGRAAQNALWNSPGYANAPLSDALSKWSGSGYTPGKLGFQPDQTFSGMSDADQQRLLDRQQQFEGWKPAPQPDQAPPVPLPPPRPNDMPDQAPVGMNQPQDPSLQGPAGQSLLAQQPQIDPLALALAGGGDPNNPQMSPAIVAMLNAAAPAPEISMSDFGGLGGLFG